MNERKEPNFILVIFMSFLIMPFIFMWYNYALFQFNIKYHQFLILTIIPTVTFRLCENSTVLKNLIRNLFLIIFILSLISQVLSWANLKVLPLFKFAL